jgi:threonylcarbamoyladenosine tRNA methylthiotransferase MtaB
MPEIVTFGCRLNIAESETMRRHAEAAGLQNAIIVNTCAVTAEAERQALQSIRRLKRERPDARIIVTGCAAHIHPEKFLNMPEVERVIANDRKTEAGVFRELVEIESSPLEGKETKTWRYASNALVFAGEGVSQISPPSPAKTKGLLKRAQVFASSPSRGEETLPRQEGDLQRAFIEVQNGCDHRCTFCIIPFGRGASRSKPMGAVAEEVRALVGQGFNEIVFTGVDIASYGKDLPAQPRLGQMARRVLAAVPELRRLRLSSLDPAAVDEDLWRLIAEEPRLMPHLHLSLQAGDDMILKRMKRRHNRADMLALCDRARRLRPDIVFGADIIAGFPTETEAMFANTLGLVKECGLTWLHVFPYSARKGTPAANMPQVHGNLRRERAERLRQAGVESAARHYDSLIGQTVEVLVERQGIGCTPHFAKIKLTNPAPTGALVNAKILRCDGEQAAGVVIAN